MMKNRGMAPHDGQIHNTWMNKERRFGGTVQGRVNQRMANIVLCDRCGSIATDKVAGFVEIQPRPDYEPEGFGLCPGCVGEVYTLLKSVDTAPKALTAYREPFEPETVVEQVTNPKETTERAILDGD
jgi:hypothetical protein